MIRVIFKFLFTFVSLLFLAVIYLINSKTEIGALTGLHITGVDMPAWVSYTIYCVVTVLLTFVSSLFFKQFEKLEIRNDNIKCIESADCFFLPIYVAYVFVGLSILGLTQLFFCYAILSLLCFSAQTYLFNPVFYLLGYKFYFLTNSINQKVLVMTKRKILLSSCVDFPKLYRINDYTYVEL